MLRVARGYADNCLVVVAEAAASAASVEILVAAGEGAGGANHRPVMVMLGLNVTPPSVDLVTSCAMGMLLVQL